MLICYGVTPEVGRAAEPVGDGGFEIGYVTDDGLEHRVSLSQAWATPFESCSPIRRFTSHKGQRHLSGLWWSATTGGTRLRVVDSRYEGFKFTLTDVVADNVSAGGFYLGPVTRRPSELEDLGLIGCVVRVAGEVVMTAAGAAVMGHPAASVAWLANQLAAEEEGLRAGQLVFSGGVTAPVPVVAGGSVTFQFGGLGSIEVAGA